MDLYAEFAARLAAMPVVAILRGVRTDEVEAVVEAILRAGITVIEVPLNSPDPLESIRRLTQRFAGQGMFGAGTVLSVDEVARCKAAGCQLIVSPNMRPDVIAATRAAGMISAPGCLTPTEVFSAFEAGAHAVKLFPGELVSPAAVKALRAVLPASATVLVVGGVTAANAGTYIAAGATGLGVGGSIFRPGTTPAEAGKNAETFAQALRQ